MSTSGETARPTYGLQVRKGSLLRNGKFYPGIGVNYFNAFARHLKDPNDTSYEAGFRGLEEAHIPFARFMACGFWPVEQRLYRDNPQEFLRRLDDVVRAADRHQVGLIPSLFWHLGTVPDLVGEPVGAWGDPKSRTYAYLRDYVRDIVTRYRSSPAIWGWEFGNEYCLAADLPNASQHRPPLAPGLGTPSVRTARDELTYAAVRTAYRAFAREVRRWDPDRMIEPGDAFPRESASHNWKEKSWTRDTPEQSLTMLREDTPDPMDVLSVHGYEADVDRLSDAVTASRRLGKPLLVGEFGAEGAPSRARSRSRSCWRRSNGCASRSRRCGCATTAGRKG